MKGGNPVRDVDCSKDDEPVKSGDDAVAKENSCWVGIACGWNPGKHWKTYVSPIFTSWSNNYKEPLDSKMFHAN